MARKKSLIPGFSLKRATGVTKAKQKIARATGVPTTKEGRKNKLRKKLLPFLVISLLLIGALASAEGLDAVYDYVTAQGFEVGSDAPGGFQGAPVPYCLCMETKMTVGDDMMIPMCYVIWGDGDQVFSAGGTDDESAAKARQLYVDVLDLYDWQVARYSNGADISLGYNLSAYSDGSAPAGVTEYDTLTDYTAAVYEYILTNP